MKSGYPHVVVSKLSCFVPPEAVFPVVTSGFKCIGSQMKLMGLVSLAYTFLVLKISVPFGAPGEQWKQ